jgi:TolA-binding protein
MLGFAASIPIGVRASFHPKIDRTLSRFIFRRGCMRNFFVCIILFASMSAFAQTPAQPVQAVDPQREADDSRFDNAYQLYKLRHYDKALGNLSEYLEVSPDGAHRKEAFRIIGDIYLSRFDYARALKYYSALYEEFSTDEEGIGGYYQTGICYSRMGKTDKAVEVFKMIIEQYPASTYAQKARTQLDLEELVK